MFHRTFLPLMALMFAILFNIGCSRTPQMQPANRKLLQALSTAVSAKNPEWLDATAKLLSEKAEKKEISDAEFKALNAIIRKSAKGDWQGAQRDVFAISENQRPTADDLAKIPAERAS